MSRKKGRRKEIEVINIVGVKEEKETTKEVFPEQVRVYCLTLTDRYSHTSDKTGKTYIWSRGKGRPVSIMVDIIDLEDLLRVKGNFSGKTYKNRAFVTEEELNNNY